MVIMDSALFKNPFSDRALSFLDGETVMISPTFFRETEEFSKLLDSARAETLRKNISRMITATKNNVRLISTSLPFDVYNEAVGKAKRGEKVCVMTEDILLIERLRMSDTPPDVYDLNKDAYGKPAPLTKCCYVERRSAASLAVPGAFKMQVSVLKTDSGQSIRLSNRLSEESGQDDFGMESAVYDVCGHPELVAKIYRFYPSVKKHIHLKKLKKIASQLSCPWCLLPVDLLYQDGKLIGFTMMKKNVGMLSEDTLYLGDEQAISRHRLSVRKSCTLDFAITMLAQIKILNCYGLAVCDYNPNNFSAYTPNSPVVMFDTDSFILDNYFGNVIDDKAFTRPYAYDDKLQLIQMVNEQALKFCFRLLSLGANPRIRTGYPYIFSNPASPVIYRRSYFPDNTARFFEKVFTGSAAPSVNVALYELAQARKELSSHPAQDLTAKQMITQACGQITFDDGAAKPAATPVKSQPARPSPSSASSSGRTAPAAPARQPVPSFRSASTAGTAHPASSPKSASAAEKVGKVFRLIGGVAVIAALSISLIYLLSAAGIC